MDPREEAASGWDTNTCSNGGCKSSASNGKESKESKLHAESGGLIGRV